MNAKIIASLAFHQHVQPQHPVKPGTRRRAGKGAEFRHYFNGITAKPETAMDAILTGYGEEAGREGGYAFCPRYQYRTDGSIANGIFAQTVAADGSPGYWSVLIVNKDSRSTT